MEKLVVFPLNNDTEILIKGFSELRQLGGQLGVMLGWVIEINMITIDIETKSDKGISKCGIYAYTDTPYFDILLFAYSIDGQPVQVVDTANGEEIPENVLAALADENVVKRAFNCNFERVCLSKYLRENYPQYFQSYSIDEDQAGLLYH